MLAETSENGENGDLKRQKVEDSDKLVIDSQESENEAVASEKEEKVLI